MDIFATSRALLINPAGELLLVRRSATDSAHPGTWDIPGGRVESGEDIQQAVIRETTEEVGVRLHDPQLVYAVSALRPQGSGTWLFFVEHVPAHLEVTLGDEHDDLKWVPFADLPQYTDYPILLGMHEYLTANNILM